MYLFVCVLHMVVHGVFICVCLHCMIAQVPSTHESLCRILSSYICVKVPSRILRVCFCAYNIITSVFKFVFGLCQADIHVCLCACWIHVNKNVESYVYVCIQVTRVVS
jgi:hypothetical protein